MTKFLRSLAGWLYRIAYRESLWDRDEAIKKDFLQRGLERGRTLMRHGQLFDLYLQPAEADNDYARATQLQGGIQVGQGKRIWYWWCTVSEDGREVALGPLATITPEQAFAKYIALLPEAAREEMGISSGTISNPAR